MSAPFPPAVCTPNHHPGAFEPNGTAGIVGVVHAVDTRVMTPLEAGTLKDAYVSHDDAGSFADAPLRCQLSTQSTALMTSLHMIV